MKKFNRNSDCWCGSKLKYKKCCMEMDLKLKSFKIQGYPIPKKETIKTPEEIIGIKKSCELTKYLLNELETRIKPGVTTNELNDWVHNETLLHKAIPAPLNYKGFPKSICTSKNNVICHGIPNDDPLEEGDILNVDITCILNGFYGDSCRMYKVGQVSKDVETLSEVTKESLYASIEAIKPYESINNIGDAIERVVTPHGYGIVEMFGGHGIGNEFHEDPFVYHYSKKQKLMICVPGMVFTIEPMINLGTYDCKICDDGWTAVTKDGKVSAQWEHTLLITETGAEILT